MADNDKQTSGASAPAGLPTIPATDRLSVPASALFSPDEMALAGVPPADKPADSPPSDKPAGTPPAGTPPAGTPPADEKVKIGDKDYTKAELEQLLAERVARQAAEAAAPKPTAKPAPASPASPEPPKAPTPEEVAKLEGKWRAQFVENEKLSFPLTGDDVETILSGGEDSAKLLSQKLTDVCATAVLLARKSVFADLNPTFEKLTRDIAPLMTSNGEIERVAAEQQFVSLYPDFKAHMDTARQVGEALLERFPAECAALTREQLLAEVAAQTDRILQAEYKRWNPAATGTWRDMLKAAPAAPAAPAVSAPASNAPAASPSGGLGKDWHKSTAQSLAD